MKAGATVEEIHTEMTENEGALGDHTTTTGQNSWQQGFLPLELTKEGASPDPTTGATTTEAAVEAVGTTVGNHTVRGTKDKSGEGRIGPRSRTTYYKKR